MVIEKQGVEKGVASWEFLTPKQHGSLLKNYFGRETEDVSSRFYDAEARRNRPVVGELSYSTARKRPVLRQRFDSIVGKQPERTCQFA